MTGLYLFAAAAGVPLVLWFVLAGGDEGGADSGDADGGDGGLSAALHLLPLSTVAFFLATFGVCGLLLGLVGTAAVTTFVGSAAAALAAGALNTALFSYLRRTESASDVSERRLAGAVGRVVLPVADGRRGRVAVDVGGQQLYLSAQSMPDTAAELEVGAPVLVVEVEGGIALVTRLDQELA